MSSSVTTIPADPPENKGLDYSFLRTEGVRITQELSGSIWTDYNEHDPGVTTLEQLCYALTELSYRAEFPVADLLVRRESGKVDLRRQGLYPPRQIFPCNPVTVDDYRKLLVDRVDGVANAWLIPYVPQSTSSRHPKGLYDVRVYVPHARSWRHREDEENYHAGVKERVKWAFNEFRSLCEDIRSVTVLRPLDAVVRAEVDIAAKSSPERTMAEILFSIGNLMAPEVARQPLSSLLADGQSAEQIFNGPLLLQGFIGDDQLLPQAASLDVNEIVAALTKVPDVARVRKIEATVAGQRYGLNGTIPIPPERYLRLDVESNEETGQFPIRLFQSGALCRLDADLVQIELSLMWDVYRRPYPLEAEYDEYFPVPTGKVRDIEGYYSVQNQYPAVYGISSYGLPAGSSPKRRGQAKQLKGYLLPFEQLMADYFAQLAHVKDLFSVGAQSPQTYYWQSLARSVPDVQPLLENGYSDGVQEIVARQDPSLQRRADFLEYLLSLYANELTPLDDTSQAPDRENTRLIRARRRFLRVLARSTETRGSGFDVLRRPSLENVAGMEYKCKVQMGLDVEQHRPLGHTLKAAGTRLGRGPISAGTRIEARHAQTVEQHFQPISAFEQPDGVPSQSSLLQDTSLSDEVITALQDPENLRIGSFPGDDAIVIICRVGPDGDWIVIAVFGNLAAALLEAFALLLLLHELYDSLSQLYIVEHILLRDRLRPHDPSEESFDYSFTVTAVVGLPWRVLRRRENRRAMERIIRENTPALISARVCFLGWFDLLEFETIYFVWREALLSRDLRAIDETSAVLRRFLQSHRSVAT